jgi:four helix bundle protein
MATTQPQRDAYQLSLDFLVLANQCARQVPSHQSELSAQLLRASTSLVLSLAEGARDSRAAGEQGHQYRSACDRAAESAALLDACARLSLLDRAGHHAGTQLLVSVVSLCTHAG